MPLTDPQLKTAITAMDTFLKSNDGGVLGSGASEWAVTMLALLRAIESGGVGGVGTPTSPADVAAGIDLATDIDLLIAQIDDLVGSSVSLDSKLPTPISGRTPVVEANSAAILAELQNDRAIASSLFIDATNTTYLKVLAYNQTSNAYEATNLSLTGFPYTPSGAETPISRTDFDVIETVWRMTNSGSGYSNGDFVSQFVFLGSTPPTILANLWVNDGVPIAQPPAGHRTRIGAVLATENTLSAINAKLTSKAASTAPVAADPALVVSISPNCRLVYQTAKIIGLATATWVPPIPSGSCMTAFHCQSQVATAQFVQIFDKATAPVTGDVPLYSFRLAAVGATVYLDAAFFGEAGEQCVNGIVVGISSTNATFTALATPSINLWIKYR